MPRDWEQHFSDATNLDFTPEPMLVEIAEGIPPGTALDLACGAGRNSLYLAALGWQVTAVDSSPAAIRLLRERAPAGRIDARAADLEAAEFVIAPCSYDLICDFLYLQRSLFPPIRSGVRPGGTFAGTILLADPAVKSHNPAFLLQPGELRAEFAGWKILYYSESPNRPGGHPLARIIARRA